jgi:hypothetical protein
MEYHFNFAKKPFSYKDLPQEGGRLTLAYSRIYDSANQTVFFQVEKGGRIETCMVRATLRMITENLS